MLLQCDREGTVTEKASTVESQLVLLLDDDQMITEGLAAALERERRTIITCNDVESAELIVERSRPSHVISDIHVSGPFGYEGLDFIAYTKKHSPETRIILISGDAPDAVQMEGAVRGAVAFLQKPFEVKDLDALLDLMTCSAGTLGSDAARVIHMPLMDELLKSPFLNPFFQPLVSLKERWPIFGYESLARYRELDSPFRNPEVLFRYGARKGRIADLECVCVRNSLVVGSRLPSDSLMFMNVHPDAFEAGGRLCDTIATTAEQADIRANRIVLEVTEQGNLNDCRDLTKTIHRLQDMGVRFAFDDLGVAYSHLPLIDKLQPSFLKVSQHFGTGFEKDGTKEKIIANLLSLAHDFDAALILEGIETEETARAAAALGIPFGQGFFFGHPADVSTFR